jgi:gliding motility-associated-like protein
MKAISLYGCRNDSIEMKFYTYYVPVPSFTATDTAACGPLTVTFNNNTPNQNLFTYLWNFGNGQTSNLANPGSVTFATSPLNIDTVYKVTLTASTFCGNVNTIQNIRVKSKPKALFAPSKTVGCSPLDVIFNNNSRGSNVTYFWDFDDGATFTTTTAGQVQHQFITSVQDTFYVKLKATNECGSDSSTFAIIVSPNNIRIDFAVNGFQVNGCAPHVVSFINNSSGATGFNWNFGDGNTLVTTKNVDTITHTYLNPGVFTVRLEATNGCSDTTDYETVNVFARPRVNFTTDKFTSCIGDSIRFTNLSDTAIGYSWFFGDGGTSNLTNPSHKYASAGVYTVTLVGTRNYGPGNVCTDTIRQQITVVSSLPGSFTMSDSTSNCAPLSVTFTNKNTPSSLTVWDFGNGVKDTGDVVTYNFALNGNYNVTMTATSPGGCRYNAQKLVVVNSPQGTFTYDNGYICGSTPVRFEVVGQNIDSLRWNFGDGTIITSTNRIVYHIYPQNGFYVPSVQIIGGANCRITLQGADTIKVDNINAGFRFVENKNCGFTTVAFTDTSRAQFGITNYKWSFGDGDTSILRNPVHNYLSTGNYNIRLIITSASGCKDTAVTPTFIKVNDKPIVAIQGDSVGCQNAAMSFTSVINSIDPITTYNWNMGNSFVANTPGVQTSYGAAGVYNAQVIVGTSEGCFDTAYKLIFINPAPNTKAGVDVALCRGQSTQLQAIGATSYLWSPTNGLSCITCPDPIATPNFTTKYVVTGSNGFGCSSKDTVEISVAQPFNIVASPDRDICIGDSTRLTASGGQRFEWFPATGLSDANSATPMAKPTVTTTYRVIAYDNSSCFTDTAFVTIGVGNYPIVNAGIDRLLAAGATQRLTPTATNGPISVWQWTPATDLSCSVCPQPIATAKKDICYTATATNQYGCSGSDTVCIKVFCESSQIFIPNGFTPDGDGLNDVLMVRGTGIKQVKSFRIFNRWGQVVFERANFPPNVLQYGWDGKTNGGVAAPPDVYVYTCDVICENDIPYTFKGNVAIIK